MTSTRFLNGNECWEVSGLNDAAAFFRAVPNLLPDATHVYLEGSPAPDVAALISTHADQRDYIAPRGTLWSWPRSRRLALKASPSLFAQLAAAAPRHAEPEICSHLHFYRGSEPLAQWFDAFFDPLLVSKTVPRDDLERFCREAGGTLADASS